MSCSKEVECAVVSHNLPGGAMGPWRTLQFSCHRPASILIQPPNRPLFPSNLIFFLFGESREILLRKVSIFPAASNQPDPPVHSSSIYPLME